MTNQQATGGDGAASRWGTLASYAAIAACTQLLWLTFAPITTDAAQHYGVSEGAIGWLANVFPLLYVVLGIPAGRLLDRSMRTWLAVGAVLAAAGGLVRLAGGGFGVAIAGQLLVAVAQPLVLNAVTALAGGYLAHRHRAAGIALGSASLFVGMIAAFVLGAAVGASRMTTLLAVQAALTVVATVAVLVALRRPGPFAALAGAGAGARGGELVPAGAAARGAVRRLWADEVVRRLVTIVTLGFGVFIALTTWLQALLKPAGVSTGVAGALLLGMVAAGTAGSAVLPAWAARRGRRTEVIRLSVGVTVVGCAVLAVAPGVATAAVAVCLMGLLLLADLPILLEVAENRQGGDVATLAALVWLAGNAGGVVVSLAVQGLLHHPAAAFALLAVVLLAGVPVMRTRWLDAPARGDASPATTPVSEAVPSV
ncbi:MFS transporter [Frankia sp. AgB1.9]|uniref:MFS transporter n=1 Tax=unclassified Frankia TaxID=2632575 RepID=UPI0019335652|nr:MULTISPECIES: MFS transporter [unclassified Frankia]MBL7490278.1 MFS transporter [Frankia sp. AgW1.1]MBL7549868.1 MFS transporter [Frankia sp. AgB1.9]MBL7623016.1 MFS transporter [Frankia sp. AgB1.8]